MSSRRVGSTKADKPGKPESATNIVAFDFDGTLTVRDSFLSFLTWRAGPVGWIWGGFALAPALGRYLLERDRARMKAAAVRQFLRGAPASDLRAWARTFAETHSATLLRPDALRTWSEWRAEGATLVIVTASPDILVAPFAEHLGADHLLGTRLALDENDRITGELAGENCRGPEKRRRLEEIFGPDVRLTAAYGDTAGDADMLAIADHAGYREFQARP